MADLSPRDLQEVLDKLVDLFGSRTEKAREEIAETEVLSEAERLLRQREQRERKEAADEIKKARADEREAIWNSLDETEKQLERQKELDAAANQLTEQQKQKDIAYGLEKDKIIDDQLKTFRRRADYELESLGFQRDSQGKLHQLMNEREEIEKKLIEDLQKGLAESPDLQKKYGTDAKNAKLAMDQEKLYKQQLASMGRYVDSNNKIIDTTIKLNKEQEASLRKIKAENEARDKAEKSLEEFKDMFGKKGAIAAGSFALTAAFDFLKAGVVGTYKGLIAYEDALLDGVRGQSVAAAMVSEQQNAYADSIEKTGGGLVDFGATMMAVGVQVTLATGPIGLLAVAIGGLLAILGYASQAEATIIRRDAELNKKRAALEDEAFKHFLELGEASMTGARGVTGMIDDLKRVGLTIKEFDKLNKILSANSKEIAMFGATTVDGSKKFIEVTGNLLASGLSKTFEKMGISQNSQMEHAQKFMAQQARFGIKIQGDQTKAVGNYITELDRVAALTGASRKEQEQARAAVMADRQTRAALYAAQKKLKENPNDQEAILRVKSLQDTIRIATNLRSAGMTELSTGYQQNMAAGGITSQASAMAEMMVPELLEATRKGTVVGSGLTEATVGIERQLDQFANNISLVPDALLKLVPEFDKLADNQIMMAAAMEAKAKSEAKGKPFDENKFIDAYRKAATDARTTSDVDIFRRTQQEAIEKQTQLLNGQLGAGKQMLEAAGMFGKAGKTMLDAGKYMWNAAFKGTKGAVENLTADINDKDMAISGAANRQNQAQLKYDKEKAAGKITKETSEELATWTEQVKLLTSQKTVLEKKRKIQEDIVALETKAAADTKALEDLAKARLETFDAKKEQLLAAKQAELDKKIKAKEFDQTRAARELDAYKKQLDAEREKITPESEKGGFGLAFGTAAGNPAGVEAIQKALLIAKEKKLKELNEVSPTTIAVSRGQRNVQKKNATDTAEEAPEYATGGVVPGTSGGTTVVVGEKGRPEAIMPLDVLSGMLGGGAGSKGDSDIRYAQILKLNSNFAGSIDVSSKSVELEKIGNDLSKDNNKLIETQNKTSDKLIISMNKVTDMLPNVLSQIISAIASGSGAGNTAGGGIFGSAPAGGGIAPAPQSSTSGGTPAGGMVKAGTDMLKKMGLIFSPGRDLQKENGDIDPKLIEIAKQVQATIPGFQEFTGFNDAYHTKETPNSQHTKGKAFDFALNRTPSKEEGDKIKSQLKALGLDLVKDEYNDTSGAFRTGGHFHGQLNAYDGGVFEPRPGGVHVNLAEAGLREAAVPLNPGEKIRVEKSEQENNPPRKDPLSTVLATDAPSNSNQAAEILAGIHDLMEDKFDSMISAIRDGNNISDKILKYSQA